MIGPHQRLPRSVGDTRTRVAASAAVAVGKASQLLRFGEGTVIGGRIGLAIDPALVSGLAKGRRIALVSGTNGKTTTTKLLVAALGGPGRVATSTAGSNLPPGLVVALASAPAAATAVLEVDEGYLGRIADAIEPDVVILLNLSRDQLDRMNEVRMLAGRWREAVGRMGGGTTIVANADDPLVVWATRAGEVDRPVQGPARSRPRVVFVGAGELWHADATGCPSCGGRIRFGADGDWSCECGFGRPRVDARLTRDGLVMADGSTIPISLSLPARCNRANAAMAAIAAGSLGVDEKSALEEMSMVRDVEGRFATVGLRGTLVRLLLAKNPAGWAELLDLLTGSGDSPVVIGINARTADGHDPSWLWDVAFEELASRRLVATGERHRDLAVRLKYAGAGHMVVPDQLEALFAPGDREIEYVGNYTAFQQLRRVLPGPGSGQGARPRAKEWPVFPPLAVPLATESWPDGHGRAPGDRPEGKRRGATESALRVAVVHPDLLGTYGDGGNGRILACRAAWRGYRVELILADSSRPLPTADIYCLGGGEDGPQVEACALMRESAMPRAIEAGAAVLAVCAGFQIVGRVFPDAEGRACEGLGLLDVETEKGPGSRPVGEIVSDPVETSLGTVAVARMTGFENHGGITRLGAGAAPLGRVLRGVGNGDGMGTEGAVQRRVVGTYLHGPVLARNASLADAILSLATGEHPAPLTDTEEEALHTERLQAATLDEDVRAEVRRPASLTAAGRLRAIERLVRTRHS